MCVTLDSAEISGTRTFVYATTNPSGQSVHVSGYQNVVEETLGPNCMFLNFAGTALELVHGPERTQTLMMDLTEQLPQLPSDIFLGGSRYLSVAQYGDYDVILSESAEAILGALGRVRRRRRPANSPKLHDLIQFYSQNFPGHTYALACFNGAVKPKHPIVVSYLPHDPAILTIPGLDGHDGGLPVIGEPGFRNFRVAFAAQGVRLPHQIMYRDRIGEQWWAPQTVAGFYDLQEEGPNADYRLPVAVLQEGSTGSALATKLILAV